MLPQLFRAWRIQLVVQVVDQFRLYVLAVHGHRLNLFEIKGPELFEGPEHLHLYRRHGIYEYENGINRRAVAALAIGAMVALLGLVAPPLRLLYDYAWFVGFGVAGVVYVTLMQRAEAPAENTELEGEA